MLLSCEIVMQDRGAFDTSTIAYPNDQYHYQQCPKDLSTFVINSGLLCNGHDHTFLHIITDTELFTQILPYAWPVAEDQI